MRYIREMTNFEIDQLRLEQMLPLGAQWIKKDWGEGGKGLGSGRNGVIGKGAWIWGRLETF